MKLLFSICISINFSIICIRKYVIEKKLFIHLQHKSMGLISAMTIIASIKAPEVSDL